MGIARSTYYDQPETAVDDTALVETMGEISDSFEPTAIAAWEPPCGNKGWSFTTRSCGG